MTKMIQIKRNKDKTCFTKIKLQTENAFDSTVSRQRFVYQIKSTNYGQSGLMFKVADTVKTLGHKSKLGYYILYKQQDHSAT